MVTYWLLIGYLLEAPHQRLFPVNQSPNQCCRTSLRSYERVPYVRVPVQPVLVGTNATRDRASGVDRCRVTVHIINIESRPIAAACAPVIDLLTLLGTVTGCVQRSHRAASSVHTGLLPTGCFQRAGASDHMSTLLAPRLLLQQSHNFLRPRLSRNHQRRLVLPVALVRPRAMLEQHLDDSERLVSIPARCRVRWWHLRSV